MGDFLPQLDHTQVLEPVETTAHRSFSRQHSIDELLCRTNCTTEQPSLIGADTGERATYGALLVDELNNVASEILSPTVQSRVTSGHHELLHQSYALPEQGLPYLRASTQQPVHKRAGNAVSSNSLLEESTPANSEDVDLEVLDYLASNPYNLELLSANSTRTNGTAHSSPELVTGSSPDLYNVHYPEAAYKELHSQLHNHIVETTRAVALTAPDIREPETGTPLQSSPRRSSNKSSGSKFSSTSSGGPRFLVDGYITSRRAIELWQNYLDEVAPWLDMFDDHKHWQTTVAQMAQHVDCLQYSLLALSSRQQERKTPTSSDMESLYLYQEAIRLITVQLPTLTTEVIATVILLCVLEMMSSSQRAWSKHLDGCAMLLEAAGIDGMAGGVREVLFWTFARMDVYKALISDTVPDLPVNRWFLSIDSMSQAVRLFRGKSGSANYANYAVFLYAGVVYMISTKGQPRSRLDHDRTFVSRWKALYDLHEEWYNDRPKEMKPLMDIPPSQKELQTVFNTVLYSTPVGISGNQVYHASMILLLQDKPKEIRVPKSCKSMLWHARQICGISISNSDHGALINALQPIWIAAKLMSHPSEHKAILDLLNRLEESTGWATSWCAADLKEFWGVWDDEL